MGAGTYLALRQHAAGGYARQLGRARQPAPAPTGRAAPRPSRQPGRALRRAVRRRLVAHPPVEPETSMPPKSFTATLERPEGVGTWTYLTVPFDRRAGRVWGQGPG